MKADTPRALHISYALDFGGVETHLRLIAEAKTKRFEHQFCALTNGGAAGEAIRKAGSRVHELRQTPWQRPLSTVAAVRALAKRIDAAVIHCHGADANLFGLVGGRLAGTPVRIGEEVALRPHRMSARLLLRSVYATADCVVAVSGVVARHLQDLGEAPESKIVRLYNPVKLSERHAQERKPEEKLRLAFTGRLAPEKNPQALIEAMALLNDENCELILIGDGVQRDELETLSKSLNSESQVRMAGFVTEPDRLLATAHLYVQPSLHEGMGIALVEAMSCGLPAIVSAHGGMREIVRHMHNGWLLDDVSPASIADVVRTAAHLRPDELARMGANARRSVAERFDPQCYVQTLEDLYGDRLAKRGLTAPS